MAISATISKTWHSNAWAIARDIKAPVASMVPVARTAAMAAALRRLRRIGPLLLLAIVAAPAWAAPPPPALSQARTTSEAGLVDIRSLVPDIGEAIHYAGSDNFTGVVVDGYRAPKCFLLRPAAE